jgi:hypothetical protein
MIIVLIVIDGILGYCSYRLFYSTSRNGSERERERLPLPHHQRPILACARGDILFSMFQVLRLDILLCCRCRHFFSLAMEFRM